MLFGFIKIHRQIQNSFLWQEKYNELQAWLFILMSANYQKTKKLKSGKLYDLERGQAELSIRFLMKQFDWSEIKVSNFLKILEKEKMIKRILIDKKFSIIEVINYSKYQDTDFVNNDYDFEDNLEKKEDTDRDTERDTDRDTERDKLKEYKKDKNKKEIYYCSEENKLKNLDIEFFKSMFPEIDIEFEINSMNIWLEENPKKRKKKYKTFIINWLKRSVQNKNNKKSNRDNSNNNFHLIEKIILDGRYRSESQLHLLPELEAEFIRSLPCGFVTVNELSGNEFEYNKLKKQYREFIKENI